ncbi:MAG: hypothetical protein PHT94_01640 [Candidatus Nanoarchaeia archaeon]|nr:hypothetical protein [Candidatus Nanoarchaeia archaeon]
MNTKNNTKNNKKSSKKNNLKLKLKVIFMFIVLIISAGSIIAESNENNIINLNYKVFILKEKGNYNLDFEISDRFYNTNRSSFDKCILSIYDEKENLILSKKYTRNDNSNFSIKEEIGSNNNYYFLLNCKIKELDYYDSFNVFLNDVESHVFTENKQLEITKNKMNYSLNSFFNFFL